MQISLKQSTVKWTPILVILVLALLLVLGLSASQQLAQQASGDTTVTLPYRLVPNEQPPRDDAVAAQAAGIELGSSRELLDAWYKDFYANKEKGGPNPRAYEARMAELAAAEKQGMSPNALGMGEIGVAQMLMVPFEFAGEDVLDTCDDEGNFVGTSTVEGPLHGTIPDPSLDGDNNTIWTDDFSVEWYEKLMFGDGVGVIRTDLNDGAGVDLTGVSARNYYVEQSEGLYDLQGEIYPVWVQLDHSVAYYGWDGNELNPEGTGYPCDGTPSGYGNEFIIDILKKINEEDPDFDWAKWDTDKDGVVDHFMAIHAGVDNSAGGGEYGNYQLWAHSWDVFYYDEDDNFQVGWVVDDGGTPENPDDDIRVVNYTHIPEDASIGIVVHEYGHDIGLPDYYDQTGATSNSSAQWINMSSGSWSGDLGGSHPAPFNPWGRYFFGWSDPKWISYDDPAQTLMIGQSDPTPAGTEDSVWIGLPDQSLEVENLAGDGKGLHSILGNNVTHTLSREFDLSGASNPVFTFDTSFAIEEDWDYTYVSASTDGGSTWTVLLNDEGIYATTDPNSTLPWRGPGGLTGEYEGALTYDLSAFAGESSVILAFDYVSDAAVQDPGIWLDNFSLDDGATNLYASDLEDSSDWDNSDGHGGEGWEIVPYSISIPHYYILEWRNNQGSIASHGHNGQYYSLAHGDIGWKVDKFAANVPGMLVWYRNNFYSNNQAVGGGREFAPPATGPKGELLLVDANYEPITWSGGWWDPAAGEPAPSFSNRRSAMDGAFSMNESPAWMLHDYADASNDVLDFGSRPARPAFHDSMRSVPGWVYPGDGFVYRADLDASVVIPGSPYTTRIRTLDDNGTPGDPSDDVNIGDDLVGFWGFTVGGQPLGPGNPGDTWSHYGIHVEVVDQAQDGSYGVINFWNSFFDTHAHADHGAYANGNGQFAVFGMQYSAEVHIQNTGGLMEDYLAVVEVPDNVDYVAGSMGEGLVGVSRDDAKSVAEASDYIRTMGFDVLLAADEPDNVGFIAAAEDVNFNSSWTTIAYDYVAADYGSAHPQYLVDHGESGTFGTIRSLDSLNVTNYMTFAPVVTGN